MRESPDLILLPGDLHQGSARALERDLPRLRRILARLRAPGGAWFVTGDCERRRGARRILRGTGVRLLDGRVARLRVRDRRLAIGGTDVYYRSPAARRVVRELERPGSAELRILLSHRPDAALTLRPRSRIDLVVAGHTHGGQIQLPFLGPPWIASRVPRRVGAGGLHELDGRRVYVSRGIGVERGQAPKLRLGAPPEITLLTLR